MDIFLSQWLYEWREILNSSLNKHYMIIDKGTD